MSINRCCIFHYCSLKCNYMLLQGFIGMSNTQTLQGYLIRCFHYKIKKCYCNHSNAAMPVHPKVPSPFLKTISGLQMFAACLKKPWSLQSTKFPFFSSDSHTLCPLFLLCWTPSQSRPSPQPHWSASSTTWSLLTGHRLSCMRCVFHRKSITRVWNRLTHTHTRAHGHTHVKEI